jgi:xylulokinase
MPLVLGVDSSTQSTTAQLRRQDDGAVVWEGRASHPVTHPPRSEQDPWSWWAALKPMLDEAWSVGASGHGGVRAISVAAQQHGMVALDQQMAVLRPAKLWNDTEAAPQASALVQQGGASQWADATGSVPGPAFTVAKVAWLRDHEPATFARLAHVALPHDWLTMQICGELVTDRGDASGTGYFSPRNGRWVDEVLELIGIDQGFLPKVAAPNEAAGDVHGLLVAPGTGDNMAAALGLGLAPGDVAVSLGTSGTVFAVSETPTADRSGAVAGFCDATGHFLPLVCTLNATKVTDAMAQWLGTDLAGLDELAASCPNGAREVVLLPYLDGERTPNLPRARGQLSGLASDTSRAELARAAFDGVVCGLLDGMDALAANNVPINQGRLFLVGGGARSTTYAQTLADLSGRAVTVPTTTELAAAGACVQAAAVSTGRSPWQISADWGLQSGSTVNPRLGAERGSTLKNYRLARQAFTKT